MANDVVKRGIFLFLFFTSICTNPIQKCSFPMDQNLSDNGDSTSCKTTKSKSLLRNCELLEQITKEICSKDDFKEEILKVKDTDISDEDLCNKLNALAAEVPFISNYSLIKDKEYCDLICLDVETELALRTWLCNNIFIGAKLIQTKTKKFKLQKFLISDLSNNKNAGKYVVNSVEINGDIKKTETTTTTTRNTTNSNSIATTVSKVLHVNPQNNAASSNDNEKLTTSDKKETSNDANVSTEASTKKENGAGNALSTSKIENPEKNENKNDENTKMSTESSTSTIVSSSTTTTTTTVTTPTVEVTAPTTISTISTASSTEIVTTDTTTIPSTEKNLQRENEVNMKQTDDEPNEDTQSSDDDDDDGFTGQTGEGNNHDLNYDLPTDGDQLYPPEKPVEPVEDKATSGVIMPGPEFPQYTDSHFFVYFLTAVVICVLLYLAFHNKQKIIALIIEGRHERRRRSSNISYKKLDNNLDQVLHGTKGSAVTPAHIIY